MTPRDFAAYAYLSLAWGLSFLLLLHVVDAFGWIGAVTFRCFIAGALLYAIARLMRRRLDFSAGWLPFTIVGATTVMHDDDARLSLARQLLLAASDAA